MCVCVCVCVCACVRVNITYYFCCMLYLYMIKVSFCLCCLPMNFISGDHVIIRIADPMGYSWSTSEGIFCLVEVH